MEKERAVTENLKEKLARSERFVDEKIEEVTAGLERDCEAKEIEFKELDLSYTEYKSRQATGAERDQKIAKL